MAKERIRWILDTHRKKLNKKITKTIDKGWKEWSLQAAEFHILRADQENRQKEGCRFRIYKMDEASIRIIQEELSEDFYSLAQKHSKEIKKMLDKYDDEKLQQPSS